MARANSPVYRVPFRRRREGRTKYRTRFAMLKSRKPRLVVRKTNRDLVVQLITYSPEGDKTVYRVNKKELEKHGWLAKANMPTAYLYGLLLAKKVAKSNKANKSYEEAILDIGLNTPTKNSIVFAVAKGANDGGLNVKLGMELDEKRINGEHIQSYAKKLKEEGEEKYKKVFSSYLKSSIKPEELTNLFAKVKEKIMES